MIAPPRPQNLEYYLQSLSLLTLETLPLLKQEGDQVLGNVPSGQIPLASPLPASPCRLQTAQCGDPGDPGSRGGAARNWFLFKYKPIE